MYTFIFSACIKYNTVAINTVVQNRPSKAPLHMAAEKGNKHLVELLLDSKASVNDAAPYRYLRLIELSVLCC